MRLQGLGVIAEAVLELDPGLTVVTGETGAGKTMVVTGLGLLLGGRADSAAVRTGAARAVVEGRLTVPADGPVARRAAEAGADLDEAPHGDRELIVSRTISTEGRGRAHLGGRAVPVAVLAELSGDLVAVHGQSDQLRLRSGRRQRHALDRFAGAPLSALLEEYRPRWKRLRQVDAELDEITTRARERAAEAELLRLGLAEVERVGPRPGEDRLLRAEAERLGHAEDLGAAAGLASRLLSGDDEAGADDRDDVLTLLARARQSLDQAGVHDPRLADLALRLAEVAVLAGDVAAECAGYAQDVDADPARLAAVEERRAVLAGLTRSYGPTADDVLAWAAQAGLRLVELDGDDDRAAALVAERDQLHAEISRLADGIGRERRRGGERLAAAVTAELSELAMPQARLEVSVTGGELGPDGRDEVELLLVPHAGAPARPLARGASGGELSRVMLGLEVVLGAADPVPTFVFDEVDAGVGGEAALGIGSRLARLADAAQVIVVTHLPQVAAYADRHLVVTKAGDGKITESGVRCLDRDGRIHELARMLGGMADSGSAQAHAEELLAAAVTSGRRRPHRAGDVGRS